MNYGKDFYKSVLQGRNNMNRYDKAMIFIWVLMDSIIEASYYYNTGQLLPNTKYDTYLLLANLIVFPSFATVLIWFGKWVNGD